jgi:hypothetical protein
VTPFYAVRQVGRLIDVVDVFFEQLQEGFGWNRCQFLPVALHAEGRDDLSTQFEPVARVIDGLG